MHDSRIGPSACLDVPVVKRAVTIPRRCPGIGGRMNILGPPPNLRICGVNAPRRRPCKGVPMCCGIMMPTGG